MLLLWLFDSFHCEALFLYLVYTRLHHRSVSLNIVPSQSMVRFSVVSSPAFCRLLIYQHMTKKVWLGKHGRN